MAQSSRPLSPHLFIYKPQITMVMSIMHRITGAGLYLGFAIVTWWLVAAAWSAEALDFANRMLGHWPGKIILFGYTWALFHHMLGGIRHLIWDTGKGYSEGARFGLAWANAVGGLAIAVLVWAVILVV